MKNQEARLTIKEFCTNHSGKMEGMISISTSNLDNTFCAAHKKCEGSICAKCYANAMCKRYSNLNKKLIANGLLLKNHDISIDNMPILNTLICRIESFGDIDNTLQVKNYFTLCKANPDTTFAMWTKNPSIIQKAIDELGIEKPNNLIIILSSLMLNKVASVHYDFVDKVFTVYDKEHSDKVTINCGARNCSTCRRCYTKTTETEYINELLK